MLNTVGENGEVIIEESIRNALGIKPGYVAVQTLKENSVEIRFYPAEHNRSLLGILKSKVNPISTTEDWDEIRNMAWTQAALDYWEKINRQDEE